MKGKKGKKERVDRVVVLTERDPFLGKNLGDSSVRNEETYSRMDVEEYTAPQEC